MLDLYLYIHICYESCKKNQHGVNQKFLVLAHTMPLHYWLGGRERCSASKKSKSNKNQNQNKIITWSSLYLYFEGLHVKNFFLASYFGVRFDFLCRQFAVTKLYFDFQRVIIHTSVQLLHKQNILSYLLVFILDHNLSYGEHLAVQPGAWLVKKVFLCACNHKSEEKKVILKFKTIARTYFVFLIAFTVYE